MSKNINTKKYSVLFIALCLWITSCRSTDDAITDENNSNGSPFNVIVNLTGAEIDESPMIKTAAIGGSKADVTELQQFEVPFDGLTNATVTLTPERPAFRTQASVNPVAGTPSITELGNNIMYNIAVYKTDGSFVDEKTFTYKTNNTNDQQGFMLDGGQTYTFVAYSVNSTSAIPTVNNTPRTLATDKLSGISGDLMYFKQNMTVSGNGKNYISVVLKHKFTKITTVIDATSVGNVSLVDNARISPVGTSADIKLSDGTLTYNTSGSSAPVLNFKILGNQKVTSDTNLLISNNEASTNPARLDIGTLIVDGTPQDNFSVNNINIIPGNKYNLVVKLGPCRKDLYRTAINTSNGNSQTLTLPATDLGVIFDIYNIDDSFNIKINGINIAQNEIFFGSSQGIYFADGSKYEDGTIPKVWFMSGTRDKPVVRVVVNRDGKVSMYGSKASGGRLYQLILAPGNSFNTVTWNTAGNNTVISQTAGGGATLINGEAIGKQSIPCTP
ncbi:hypothetical protein CMU59_06860 [Elizabethkingia anophelis]|uniref:hypothetical protein n=1 Tax=Elizabethkingia anophelis TaxID=1117645 RepID=UPI000C9C574E|nr:hypothetical protein [Elizabethkingia anophelis]MCL1689271.1 fimbrillin family protein [Elizabethkingia anophelis]MCT3760201.1 hypothetical protein [Elizabethkingia anophelis]MCT3898172.1 hypothetical protein [Elizabethkingia anophelis]MCT3974767.1 hypothetical protein [Elizabethkingia anophelis]MCT4003187.1 hypothetical protein [Elizabethkingia anophelis]